MADTRHKNGNWNLGSPIQWDKVNLALLMDIRDELQANNRRLDTIIGLANCYRIPRALDAMYEIGKAQRKKVRDAAKRKKAAASA